MTPAIFATRLWTTRRGMGLLMTMMLVVSALVYAIATASIHSAAVVEYGSIVYPPLVSDLCPGDTLQYDNHIIVSADEIPAVLHVVEGWHSETTGTTLRATVTVFEYPITRPADFSVLTSRTVPDLPPGVYWFDHVAVNGHATGYTVGPVNVLDCQ